MSKLQNFLEVLTDSELANFFTYRYHEFMPASKEKIDLEFKSRGMRLSKLEFYKEVPDNITPERILKLEFCPRCYSKKFYTSQEIETVSYSYASIDSKVDYKTCLVCLYCQDKEMAESEGDGIANVFGFLNFLIKRRR
ncbi:MAG: hypothetical protein QNK23_13690 [Crocinitomicaceae bacterium]|nr:hypothetical protein [Crocinitomicaceae bacterium]